MGNALQRRMKGLRKAAGTVELNCHYQGTPLADGQVTARVAGPESASETSPIRALGMFVTTATRRPNDRLPDEAEAGIQSHTELNTFSIHFRGARTRRVILNELIRHQ